MHGLGVDLIHPVIAVVLVEIDLDAVGRRYAVQAVIVPHKRGAMSAAIKMHSAQVSTLPPWGGSFSIQAEIGGNSTLNQAIAAKPQKKQYSRLMRPPRLNGIAL